MSLLNYPQPFYRKLRGYAFDPSFSSTLAKRQVNEVIYKIKWEPTEPGPQGEYVEVIDYDPTKQCYYAALSLEEPFVLADYGMALSEGDPRFHQQQVYAVVMSVISQFEKALGRKIIWSKIGKLTGKGSSRTEYDHRFIQRLRIYPHAMRQQNAFYSPEKNALLFGYFQASNNWDGNNVPGGAIFTCLSPDIVAHETTHAILHSIHPYLTHDTNLDMLAFHEGFADIIALLQRFTFRSIVEDQIRSSRGDMLSPESMLGDLAIQFGQAVSSNRRALRSFLVGMEPDPAKFHTVTEPHTRGGLLVAAVFDAFARLYKYRVADLLRLASNGTGILASGEIDPDLVKRLSNEACDIAGKLMQICIRALDYCPPADLTFGDYLRALITADVEYNPDDEEGLRFALMESFRRWGIIPQEVNTFSVEALKWKSPGDYFVDDNDLKALIDKIKYTFDPTYEKSPNPQLNKVLSSIERILRENDRHAIFTESQNLSAIVHQFFDHKKEPGVPVNENLLGMNFKPITYNYIDTGADGVETERQLKATGRNKFQVYKCRPQILPSPESGNSVKTMVIMFLQKVFVDLKGSPYQGFFPNDQYAFRGGASLIIDMANYEIKYVIKKSVGSADRLIRQLDYAIANMRDADNNALLMQDDEPFAALHIH
ncbi:hypothetical protein MTO98_31935 [Mucilaginibacter sp. SMC90]|uniref:hypothetical protein n=1 Tax=Mucilaginibacter sp. SMC90 TaxID=2929803 RepID=UPI001FB26336|nr:hypothetical protein [Mucilaginibacter sp. SMC90]UOE49011.1 hypothetical protein MTO98_31935 [Mucilaginibacter sp. SMC90]